MTVPPSSRLIAPNLGWSPVPATILELLLSKRQVDGFRWSGPVCYVIVWSRVVKKNNRGTKALASHKTVLKHIYMSGQPDGSIDPFGRQAGAMASVAAIGVGEFGTLDSAVMFILMDYLEGARLKKNKKSPPPKLPYDGTQYMYGYMQASLSHVTGWASTRYGCQSCFW